MKPGMYLIASIAICLALPAASVAQRPPRPVDIEVDEILAAEQTSLEELDVRLSEATDLSDELAIQKEMRQVRIDTQIRISEAYLRHAKRLGLDRQVKDLSARIAKMRDPEAARKTLLKPDARPEPGGAR